MPSCKVGAGKRGGAHRPECSSKRECPMKSRSEKAARNPQKKQWRHVQKTEGSLQRAAGEKKDGVRRSRSITTFQKPEYRPGKQGRDHLFQRVPFWRRGERPCGGAISWRRETCSGEALSLSAEPGIIKGGQEPFLPGKQEKKLAKNPRRPSEGDGALRKKRDSISDRKEGRRRVVVKKKGLSFSGEGGKQTVQRAASFLERKGYTAPESERARRGGPLEEP